MRNLIIPTMILVTSITVGTLVAMQGLALGLVGLLFVALLFIIVWLAPEPITAPTQLLNNIFAVFLASYIVWPGYISIWLAPGIPGLNPPRIIYLLLLSVWALSFFWSSQMSTMLFGRLNKNPIPVFLLTSLILWKFMSIFNSVTPMSAFIEYLTEITGVYIVFLIALSTINSTADIHKLLRAIAIAAVVVSLLGIYEALTKHLIFARYITATSDFMQFALSDKSRGGEYRAQGTFSHPLLYAEFLIFSLPITAFIFTQQQTNIRKYLLLFGIGIVVLALLLAKSRAGLGALVIVSICGLTLLSIKQILLNKRSFIRFFLPAGIFLITIALLVAVGPMLWDAISGTRLEHKSTQARLYFLQRGLSLISLEPALGYGGAKEVITKMGVFTTVDNYYLAIALEAGIPALILFLLTYVYFISIGVRLFFTQENEKAHLALALTLSLIAFAVFKAILSVPYNHTFIILTFALMFMLRDICLSPEVLPTRITTI